MSKPKILPREFSLATERGNQWGVTAQTDVTLADAKEPGYLWNVAARIRAGDIVEIAHVQHKFWLRLYVVKVDAEVQGIFTRVIEECDWSDTGFPATDLTLARVVYKGKVDRWCVVLGTSKISRGHETEQDAYAWLGERGWEPVAEAVEAA